MDYPNDLRIVRDRQLALRSSADAAGANHGARAARRKLVQIYNAGSMPSAPGYFYSAYPVDLGGAEVAGGAPITAVGSAPLQVVVLNGVPSVGDQLVATAVGGRWVAERKGGSCSTTICVTACSGIPVYPASVYLYSGSTLVWSGSTGTGGCVQVPYCSGTYQVQVWIGGSEAYSANKTLAGGTVTTPISSGDFVCCGGYLIPQTLTLTDAAGSLSFVYDPSYEFPLWTGGHSVQLLSSSVTTPNNVCVVANATVGPVRVCYQMICNASTTPKFSVQRSWSWVYEQGTLTPIWYQDPSGFTPGQFCITAPPAICGSPLTDTASFSANPTSSSPFALSGTPVDATSNATADPVGGSVVISA